MLIKWCVLSSEFVFTMRITIEKNKYNGIELDLDTIKNLFKEEHIQHVDEVGKLLKQKYNCKFTRWLDSEFNIFTWVINEFFSENGAASFFEDLKNLFCVQLV